MLELHQVSKRFGPTRALRHVDLRIEPGRTTVLIGASGSGKSTLLRLMLGLVTPDTGSVRFEGVELNAASAAALRQRMGYVIQDGGLFPHLDARRNVTLMARHLGWSPERIAARIEQVVALTRFPAAGLERFPVQLSGGQRQRVGLMRALFLEPALLLLDEPLGALDPLIRCELQEDLRAIFRALGKTVVLVTHDLAEAAFFGDCVVLVHEGRIVQQGMLADLLHAPAEPFVTRFVRAQRSSIDLAALAGGG